LIVSGSSWATSNARVPKSFLCLPPTGFGKTSQLVSWRREVLARGASPFWYSADDRDNPARLVRGLTHSAREVCGKRAFGDSIVRWLFTRSDPREAITGWLAEVAGLATEVWLMLDDVDLMPTRSRTQILEYMLGNLPANLHIATGGAPDKCIDGQWYLQYRSSCPGNHH
jgi:LuxR family maltose regulon positive regulatory protein